MRKIKIRFFSLIFGLFGIFVTAESGFADWRGYVWTYEYQTMPKGTRELEHYYTTTIPRREKSNINTMKPQLELEYGITNHWDVSMYQMYKINNKVKENDSKYDGFKVRTRYRIGEKGRFIVDPLLYLEYIRDPDFSKPNVVEAKVILAKDIADLNISYNQIFKRDLESTGKTDFEYAAGIGYRLLPQLKLGLESKGSYNKRKTAIGPTVSWSGRKVWVALGTVWGANRRTDDLEVRMIVGYPF